VALNSVLNGRISNELGFKHFFVPPWPGDEGIALGCAAYALHTATTPAATTGLSATALATTAVATAAIATTTLAATAAATILMTTPAAAGVIAKTALTTTAITTTALSTTPSATPALTTTAVATTAIAATPLGTPVLATALAATALASTPVAATAGMEVAALDSGGGEDDVEGVPLSSSGPPCFPLASCVGGPYLGGDLGTDDVETALEELSPWLQLVPPSSITGCDADDTDAAGAVRAIAAAVANGEVPLQ